MLCAFGCEKNQDKIHFHHESSSLLGDSVVTIHLSNHPHGYSISILKNKDLCLWHFKRGDSISRYLALHGMPYDVESSILDSIGTFTRYFDIPTLDTLSQDFFFMDVNFDNEVEFVVAHEGWNRIYYACFDLVNGNRHESCVGFLSPMDEEPYNNIVGGMCGKTKFDYKNQIIFISERMGCCRDIETWAKPIKMYYETTPCVRIFKKIEREYTADGTYTTEYGLVNDTLKVVSHKIE